MFKKKLFNTIKSNEGFSVKILGRVGLKYKEGPKTLFVDSEMSAIDGSKDLILSKDSIQSWDPPFDNEPIDNAKRDTIVDNIRRALKFYGLEIDVW